ncbi:MAG: general secretion pathway protein GspK [Phycisphaerales bacterium]|nr:general secretion pathway protein GspK [Phycisphaerales bacterium]
MAQTRDKLGIACSRAGRRRARRALILPVVLVILLLLALLSASFSFQVQADYSAGRSMEERLQTRLCAEAGIQAVMHLLRTQMDDPAAWYDNPEAFDQALVWEPDANMDQLGRGKVTGGDDEESNADSGSGYALRFSIVAPDPDEIDNKIEEAKLRFGVTDEASKININVAEPDQLLALIQPVVTALGYEDAVAQELVDAIVDWRDADDEPTNTDKPAESDYYRTQNPPYRAKNAPFETVEELLMVRGFNGRILYGEDYDRNGLLSEASEDDGENVFPMDNADGVLERGIYPFITVFSQEYNTSSENKPRVNLFQEKNKVLQALAEVFDRTEVITFIVQATKKGGPDGIRSLADYLTPRIINDSATPSPLNEGEIITLFDKCTVDPQPSRQGAINVNTASAKVLRAIGISAETANAIIATRRVLPAAKRTTTSWLITGAGMSADDYAAVQDRITARSRQFTIESIGFSDRRGIFTRLQAVVMMRGPVPQLMYYRDITKLGMGFPVRGKEGERRFALNAN